MHRVPVPIPYVPCPYLQLNFSPQDRESMPDVETFGLDLVRELVTPQIMRRISVTGIQTQVRDKVQSYLGIFNIF